MNNYLSVKRTKELNQSVEDVWDLISTPSYLELVHPFCESNTTESWSGVGSKDTLVYLNDLTFIREITAWDEMKGYELTIGCLLYTSPSPRDLSTSRMPSSA